jgi:hypothetical protein
METLREYQKYAAYAHAQDIEFPHALLSRSMSYWTPNARECAIFGS